jgi:hypothetical protein
MECKKEETKGKKVGKCQTTLEKGFLVSTSTAKGPPGAQVENILPSAAPQVSFHRVQQRETKPRPQMAEVGTRVEEVRAAPDGPGMWVKIPRDFLGALWTRLVGSGRRLVRSFELRTLLMQVVSESVRQATHRCGVEVTEVVVFLSDDFYNRSPESMRDAARWCQMTIINAKERAGVDALLDRESGRFSIDLTSRAITWATGLERIWGHPPEPSWVVTLELGPGVERATTLDAFAALVADAGMGGTEVRHVNQTDARTFGPFAQVWLPEQAAMFPELGWRSRGGGGVRRDAPLLLAGRGGEAFRAVACTRS